MATIKNIRRARLEKLKKVQKAGVLAYPAQSRRTHTNEEALENFTSLSRSKEELVLVGRIRAIRGHGGSTFLNIEDGSTSLTTGGTGLIQAYLKKDRVGELAYNQFLDIFDVGDFAQLRGILFKTKKGEKTLEIADYKILAKSLLPLPDKWHGLQDVDERYRKRYLDLLFNKEVKKTFETKAKITKAIREFLEDEGFVGVETSVLQHIYGGADAKPFRTHLNAFDIDVYLRIALELDLKRLIVGGFEKVYEIGRVFRNEGVDRMHNPDFTMLEFYWAYADYKDMMKLTERMFASVLKNVYGKTRISYEGKDIDFKAPWPRVEYSTLIKKHTDIDIEATNKDALFKKAKELKVPVEKSYSKAKIADEIYKKYCRPKVWEPTFVIHHPAGSMPLAKPLDEDSSKLGSFQLLCGGGWELIKAYSELNDPAMQKEVFQEQEKFFKKGLQDAQRMDTDYIEALEYGMPPTVGFGMGIDRLTALLTDSHSLREAILFPTMRPKNK